MEIKLLRKDLRDLLKKYSLEKKFAKQKDFFERNPHHPSLHTEKLEPKNLSIYSFRIDRRWRAVLIVTKDNEAEIIDINSHYR